MDNTDKSNESEEICFLCKQKVLIKDNIGPTLSLSSTRYPFSNSPTGPSSNSPTGPSSDSPIGPVNLMEDVIVFYEASQETVIEFTTYINSIYLSTMTFLGLA